MWAALWGKVIRHLRKFTGRRRRIICTMYHLGGYLVTMSPACNQMTSIRDYTPECGWRVLGGGKPIHALIGKREGLPLIMAKPSSAWSTSRVGPVVMRSASYILEGKWQILWQHCNVMANLLGYSRKFGSSGVVGLDYSQQVNHTSRLHLQTPRNRCTTAKSSPRRASEQLVFGCSYLSNATSILPNAVFEAKVSGL